MLITVIKRTHLPHYRYYKSSKFTKQKSSKGILLQVYLIRLQCKLILIRRFNIKGFNTKLNLQFWSLFFKKSYILGSCKNSSWVGCYSIDRAAMSLDFCYLGTGVDVPQLQVAATATTQQGACSFHEVQGTYPVFVSSIQWLEYSYIICLKIYFENKIIKLTGNIIVKKNRGGNSKINTSVLGS